MAPKPLSVTDRVAGIVGVFSAPDADPAWLLCDRHPADAIAFTFAEPDGTTADLSFGELRERSRRFAGLLTELGVGRGDRVATLMGKGADLVAVLLGTWRAGAVYVPLFTAFAADAVTSRLTGADAKVIVADAAQAAKVAEGPWTVLVAGDGDTDRDLAARSAAAEPFTGSTPIGGDGAFVHMFTSGTTGAPKGVVHPLRYVAGWQSYLQFGLGVRDDSVYWCGADPGWAYGLYSAVVAPMVLGLRSVLQRGGFDVAATWRAMVELGVTDYAAAPTVFRMLRVSDVGVPDGLRLRRLSSAGEPLTAEVNEWASTALGLRVHDHYGQTELGMPIGFPHHPDLEIPVTDQTMGVALPGWSVTVLKESTSTEAEIGEPGLLAVDIAASPLMTFTGYTGRAVTDRFTADGRYYLSGDLATRNADGTLRFSSRDDDVIIMAGYRIGPFDVESVLAQHAAVAECAVVAGPDPVRGEAIEAFVVLREDVDESEELIAELQNHVRQRYAAHASPRRVHVVPSLPKTASGKIQRVQLRRELREAAR
ncbi:AMP-binding protein [Amycolatopsis magusensis]|uniref:Acetyl-CoA synthetase n=1 Tax=Amycolatopsis magusensis TaxID=882444 RepID=A0ABS4PY53_9PSEU|nr:AMP-binding protein [Amycolatopsis magusensis]MBP2184360.1 acetyl-CoA synthetase [Amycolatopsis magusensis]